ncbi:MAG TPA: hypothetical protein VEK07_20585 [Polyangiaceae bacterium]|nr:hypothetical protein [Polyangiaceae bacterium]
MTSTLGGVRRVRRASAAPGFRLALVGVLGLGAALDPPAHGDPRAAPREGPRGQGVAAQSLPARPPSGPAWDPTLPMLPSVSLVRVEVAHDRVVIVEDIDLPRGDWHSGGLDLYAAFGAPGPPIAVDAALVGLVPEGRDAHSYSADERVTTRTSVRRGPGTLLLLGLPQMAGVALYVTERQLKRAYASSDRAVLRIRTLVRPLAPDSTGARDVVVRLGIAGGLPMTLGRIQVVSDEPASRITKAEATLCGPEADLWPLSVGGTSLPQVPASPPALQAPIAPSAAVRHPTDDLHVRWWSEPRD